MKYFKFFYDCVAETQYKNKIIFYFLTADTMVLIIINIRMASSLATNGHLSGNTAYQLS